MRIRKRPSREAGTGSSPFLEQVKDEQKRTMNNGLKTKQVGAGAVKQKQDGATRYGEADNIRKRKMKQEQGLMALASWAAVMSKREEEYKNKKKQECPIGCVSEQRRQAEEEIIGEQPRTPPPFAGEKPAEHGKKACSCGKKWGLRQEDMDPSLLRNKRAKNKNNHQQDTADAMARPSHEICGLEHSDEEDEEEDKPSGAGGLRRARDGDQEELRKDMGPLLKAVHAVIGEAGMQGLTAREAGELIRSRRLISDGDVPRTVKIAKAMRDSPYLVELTGNRGDCNARFVMWSTYLQTTSGKGTRGGVSVKAALAPLVTSTTASESGGVAGGSQVGRRGRRSQPQQRRRRGHGSGQYYTRQQQEQHETNPSSMVADDLVARVLLQVQKTLKAQTYQAPRTIVHQQAQAAVDNKDNKTSSHRHDIEHQEQRQCGQPQRQQQPQQRVFLIDINSLPPPASVEINVTIERKQHILEANCKPYQQQQVARPPLLIDLNLAPEDSC